MSLGGEFGSSWGERGFLEAIKRVSFLSGRGQKKVEKCSSRSLVLGQIFEEKSEKMVKNGSRNPVLVL